MYIVSGELEINLDSDFLQLKWLSNQSRMVKEAVIFYPLRLWQLSYHRNSEAPLLAVTVSCSIFNLRCGLLGFSVANGIEESNYQSLFKHLTYERPSRQA